MPRFKVGDAVKLVRRHPIDGRHGLYSDWFVNSPKFVIREVRHDDDYYIRTPDGQTWHVYDCMIEYYTPPRPKHSGDHHWRCVANSQSFDFYAPPTSSPSDLMKFAGYGGALVDPPSNPSIIKASLADQHITLLRLD